MIHYASLAVLMTPREGADGTVVFMVNLLLIFAIIYFLLIRPNKKEQERHRAMLEAIQKGDRVVTSGGIIGQVVKVADDRLVIRTSESTKLDVERGRIARVVKEEAPGDKADG